MTIDTDKLRELAQATKDIIRSHGWAGTVEMGDHMRKDESYMIAASPDAKCDATERDAAHLAGYRLAQEQAAQVCDEMAPCDCCYTPQEAVSCSAEAIRAMEPPAEWGE